MVMYRVLKDHVFFDPRGRPNPKRPNELVNVVQRSLEVDLLARGVIGPVNTQLPQSDGESAALWKCPKRVGIWLTTTHHYSGGRIHLYQYGWTFQSLGAEAYLITNMYPRWAADYPEEFRPKVLIQDQHPLPTDLDLIVTDSKGDMGEKALNYKRLHPKIPFACFNFETPNWVRNFCPEYAQRLDAPKTVFQQADILLTNSAESAKYLREWIEKPIPIFIIPPAANTTAIPEGEGEIPFGVDRSRPFALWSARAAEYKNGRLAASSVMRLPAPFDLVMIGQPTDCGGFGDPGHRIICLTGIPDHQKMALMKAAKVVLAPSLFEGYGMVPAEALCCGTPVVAFDLPVLRQEYGDRLCYAKWGDENDYRAKVWETIERRPVPDIGEARKTYGLPAMAEKIEAVPFHHVKKVRISVQLIAYWGFIPESLESIYPYVHEIRVAFGRDPHAQEIDDGSWDRLQTWIAANDVDKKILVEKRDVWEGGKLEMRRWCCYTSSGNRMLMLDGDEVWVGMEEWLKEDIQYGTPRWLTFWHDLKHWVYDSPKLGGRRWGFKLEPHGSVCPHYRWSLWRPSYFFLKHPTPVDADSRTIHNPSTDIPRSIPQTIIYHMGHCLAPEVMRAKHEFYLNRDGRDPGRIQRMTAWQEWKGDLGDCGDGIIEEVKWDLPDIVRRAGESVKAISVPSSTEVLEIK